MSNKHTAMHVVPRRRPLRARAFVPVAFTAIVAACSWATETTCADGVGCVDSAGGNAGAAGKSGAQGGKGNPGGSGNAGGAAGESGAGGAQGGAGGEAGNAGAGGGPSDCDATEGDDSLSLHPCLVNNAYALFVAPTGSDADSGTREAPLKTINRALDLLSANQGKVIVACASATPYELPVAITSGARLYGGFSCPDSETPWVYQPGVLTVVAPSDPGTALEIRGVADPVLLEDFEFDAADATIAGQSSIAALIADSSAVTLRRTKLIAGNGARGTDGVAGTKGSDGAEATGRSGRDAICFSAETTTAGGSWGPSANVCGSLPGNGGTANKATFGAPGNPGTPLTDVTPANVPNGGAAPLVDATADAESGKAGSPGNAGTPGAAATDEGSFTDAGFVPAQSGGNGTDGFPGQGGGGGGASSASSSKAYETCIGASGGAGGMGGCAGKAGTGGSAGGASVALLSWNSGVMLDVCTLVAAGGGDGGTGGGGGLGGLGKAGAAGGNGYTDNADVIIGKGGAGGPGGNGGAGGPGAGGNGGPSYAMVFKGLEPDALTSALTAGKAGKGGLGGTANAVAAPNGAAGVTAKRFSVP